jgi:methionyl-tRNA formyltransferase
MVLRVGIITQDEPFYLPEFYRSFFSELSEEIRIEWVAFLRPFGESLIDLSKRMYRLYGSLNFFRRSIEYAYREVTDRMGVRTYSVESIVQKQGIQTNHFESVNTTEFVARVRESEVDVLLSVSAPEIFEPIVLNTPAWGCINVHTSDLPSYRGMLPTFWALYHGDSEIGVTVHTMAEDIDRGRIVRQTSFFISPDATLDDVIKQGKREGGRLAAVALEDIETGSITLSRMEGEGSYFSFPTIDDRLEFLRRGNRLL